MTCTSNIISPRQFYPVAQRNFSIFCSLGQLLLLLLLFYYSFICCSLLVIFLSTVCSTPDPDTYFTYSFQQFCLGLEGIICKFPHFLIDHILCFPTCASNLWCHFKNWIHLKNPLFLPPLNCMRTFFFILILFKNILASLLSHSQISHLSHQFVLQIQ